MADFSGLSNVGGGVYTLTTNTAPLVTGLKQAEAAAKSADTVITGSLGRASQQGSRSLLSLAYAVDDLQYGFRAIVNNIPQMAMALGPTVAGAAGIAAVAVSQLINHWSELSSMLQSAWEGGSAERLKILADRADRAAAAAERLKNAASSSEEAGTKIRNKAIANEPYEVFHKALTDVMINQGEGAQLSPFAPQLNKPGRSGEQERTARRERAKYLQQRFEATAKMAADRIGGMEELGEGGKSNRDFISRMIAASPGSFSKNIKEAMKEGDPTEVKRTEEAQKAIKAAEQARKADHELAEVKKHDAAAIKKDILERLGNEKTKRIQSLQDEQQALRERRDELSKEIHKHKQAAFSEGKEQIWNLRASVIDKVPTQQLKKLEDIDRKIKETNEILKKERRATFGK